MDGNAQIGRNGRRVTTTTSSATLVLIMAHIAKFGEGRSQHTHAIQHPQSRRRGGTIHTNTDRIIGIGRGHTVLGGDRRSCRLGILEEDSLYDVHGPIDHCRHDVGVGHDESVAVLPAAHAAHLVVAVRRRGCGRHDAAIDRLLPRHHHHGMLQAPDGIAGGGIDVGQAAPRPAIVGGTAAGSLPDAGRLFALGLGVAVVPIDGGVGDRLAGLSEGIELGEARSEGLVDQIAVSTTPDLLRPHHLGHLRLDAAAQHHVHRVGTQMGRLAAQTLEDGPQFPHRAGIQRQTLLVLPHRLHQVAILQGRRQAEAGFGGGLPGRWYDLAAAASAGAVLLLATALLVAPLQPDGGPAGLEMVADQQAHGIDAEGVGPLQPPQRAGRRAPRPPPQKVRVGIPNNVHGIHGRVHVLLG
mmetsp:Transcript_18309/g.52407  ORF Transcript_18309/g.52407 Transcript_18309/m.52407 type:complete len:411 (+) Transcript_18309:964-2196(+)